MVRTFTVEGKSKGRMSIKIDARIVTEPGTLTKDELEELKTSLADKLMVALTEVRYLHASLSKIKVSR